MDRTSRMPSTIAVIGSLNVDLVTRTARIPHGGETITSRSFDTGFGGKGANQAVACARLSRTRAQAAGGQASDIKVQMVGAVGTDPYADEFLSSLAGDGLDVSAIRKIPGQKTGTAVIIVEEETGQNRILFSPGANYALPNTNLLPSEAKVAVFQLEIPQEIVLSNIEAAKRNGTSVILNPAPAATLPSEVLDGLDHLIVNESEAAVLSGRAADDITPDITKLDDVAVGFIESGVKNVVITLGSHGVYYRTSESLARGNLVSAEQVRVVDTTAAGDTFVGAYAVALARQQCKVFDIGSAIAFANRAASMTVQKEGAQSAIPFIDDLKTQDLKGSLH